LNRICIVKIKPGKVVAFVGCGGGTFFVVCTADFVGTTYEILVAFRFFYKTNCTQKLALL